MQRAGRWRDSPLPLPAPAAFSKTARGPARDALHSGKLPSRKSGAGRGSMVVRLNSRTQATRVTQLSSMRGMAPPWTGAFVATGAKETRSGVLPVWCVEREPISFFCPEKGAFRGGGAARPPAASPGATGTTILVGALCGREDDDGGDSEDQQRSGGAHAALWCEADAGNRGFVLWFGRGCGGDLGSVMM